MYWRYCDGLQEIDSCSGSVWSQLYAFGWILSAEHTALVILVSVLCLPVLFLWCSPFNRVLYFPSVQVCINSKGMPAWFAFSSLLGYSVWLAFKGEWEGENWSARDHSDECARKEERRETFWSLSWFLAHPFFSPLDIANLFCKAFNLANKVKFVGVSYW